MCQQQPWYVIPQVSVTTQGYDNAWTQHPVDRQALGIGYPVCQQQPGDRVTYVPTTS